MIYDTDITSDVDRNSSVAYDRQNGFFPQGGDRLSQGDSRRDRGSDRDQSFVYPMAVVERLTGLTRRRIRYYERCGLLRPARTRGGHRLYSRHNVETLLRVKAIMDEGITTMEAVKRFLDSGLDRPLLGDAGQASGPGLYGRRFWTPRADALGDAAVRVMRPGQAPPVGGAPETDSPSYFRRVDAVGGSRRRDDS